MLWGVSWGGAAPKSENEDQLFSLGSVKKIITAVTALRELGSDFRFSNEFTAELDDSQGLIVSPVFSVSGDPTWAHPAYGENLFTRVLKVASELKRLNVKKVTGEIRIDLLRPAVGQFHRPVEWKNSWLLECYAALPTPVSLYGNCAELTVKSSKNAYWNTPGVSTPIENKLSYGRSNTYDISPVLDSFGRVEKYVLSGTVSAPFSVAIPVHNNEQWLRNIFVQALKDVGIAYQKSAQADVSRELKKVFVDLSSKPLREILIPFLQDSINLVGDRLHIEAPGDFVTLAALLPDPTEYQNVTLLDGSGLIAADRASPKMFLHLLKAIQTQPYFSDFFAGLPVSGVSGTLENRMNDALLKNRIHAKTGTLDRVVNLAGYWTKIDQSLEPFVIFTDSDLTAPSARLKVDKLVGDFARKN